MAIVEWAEFHTQAQVSEDALIAAAQAMQAQLLDLQPGYLSRQLLALGAGRYADLIVWQHAQAATSAIAAAAQHPACQAYFALLRSAPPVALGRPLLQHQAEPPAIGGMEFSLFRLAPGADEAALPAAATQMAQGLYAQEPGFIEHMVLRNDAGLYADVVLASDADSARHLCGKWGQGPFDPACKPYLALIDPASVQLDFWQRVV